MLWGHERLFHEIATKFFVVAISWKFSFVSRSNLFMPQIGEKITLFLLSFFFSNMMSNVQAIAAITLLLDDEDEEKENVQERSQWVRPWITRKKSDGAFYTIFQDLKQEDAEGRLRKAEYNIFWKISWTSSILFIKEGYCYARVHKTRRSVLRSSRIFCEW